MKRPAASFFQTAALAALGPLLGAPLACGQEMTRDSDGVSRVIVTAEAVGYGVPDSTTATRLDTPNRDIPRAIQVIPRELIEDRDVVRVSEVADIVPGVQYSYGYGGLSSGDFFIRGFVTNGSFRDGFRDFGFISALDVAGLERIEFLKGPASVLYGQGQPGGIVNYVSKRPLASPRYAVEATYGSYDFYRASWDFSAPLLSRGGDAHPADPKDGQPVAGNRQAVLSYRLDGAYENAGSFRDYNKSESIYVAPSVTWNVGPKTVFTAFGDYQKYSFTFDRAFPALREVFRLPLDRFLGEPGDFAHAESWRAGYEFVQRFNADWQFRSGFSAIQSRQRSEFVQGFDLDTDGRSLLRSITARDEFSENYTMQNEVSGTFSTGPVAHHVLVGVEPSLYRFSADIGFGDIAPLDIYQPRYGASRPNVPYGPNQTYGADMIAGYAQDQVTLLPNLKLLAALRYDYVDTVESYEPSPEVSHNDHAIVPQIGIVYQPVEPVSLFFGWSRAFNPNFGLSKTAASFEPEEGEQFEGGVKAELLGGRLTGTLAAYHIVKENVLTSDPTDPDFSVLTGEQTSRGIEADLAGEPIKGWKLILSYAYTDAFISADNSIPVGSRLSGVAPNQFGFWTTYELQRGALRGLGAGAGAYYVDKREATLPNSGVNIPAYWRFDASLFYRRERWKAQLNLKNLADRDYYGSQGFSLTPQPPFTVLASLGYEY